MFVLRFARSSQNKSNQLCDAAFRCAASCCSFACVWNTATTASQNQNLKTNKGNYRDWRNNQQRPTVQTSRQTNKRRNQGSKKTDKRAAMHTNYKKQMSEQAGGQSKDGRKHWKHKQTIAQTTKTDANKQIRKQTQTYILLLQMYRVFQPSPYTGEMSDIWTGVSLFFLSSQCDSCLILNACIRAPTFLDNRLCFVGYAYFVNTYKHRKCIQTTEPTSTDKLTNKQTSNQPSKQVNTQTSKQALANKQRLTNEQTKEGTNERASEAKRVSRKASESQQASESTNNTTRYNAAQQHQRCFAGLVQVSAQRQEQEETKWKVAEQ